MKAKLLVLMLAALVALGSVGAVTAERAGGPPNPSGQCPPGNTPGCSPHR
jgi:Flp pilus assembly protein CpaB